MGQSNSSNRRNHQQTTKTLGQERGNHHHQDNRRPHSSIFQSIKRRRRNSLRTPRTASWNPFRSISHRAASTRRPHSTHLDLLHSEIRPASPDPPIQADHHQPNTSNQQPPEPDHPPPTQPSSPIPADPSPVEVSQSADAHTPLPENEPSPTADQPSSPVGTQTPARRIYVQGMVVVRNVNEHPINPATPADPIQPHPQPSDSASPAQTPHSNHLDHIEPDASDNRSSHSAENSFSQPHPSPPETHPPHPPDSTDSLAASTPQHSILPSQVQLEQATMISRLLSAAAAATASSLLPYAIHADGTSIQNPTNHQPPNSRPRSASHPTDLPASSARIHQASPTESHPPNVNQENSDTEHEAHAGLQTTLRDALRAAFGGALVNASTEPSPHQSPRSSASSPHAISSDQPSLTLPAPALPSSPSLPSQPASGPLTEPISTHTGPTPSPLTPPRAGSTGSRIMQRLGLPIRRHSTDHSSSSPTPPIPSDLSSQEIPATTSDSPIQPDLEASSTNHSDHGGFERFLRDLQTDVGHAILVALGAQQPAPVNQEVLDERIRLASELPFPEGQEEEPHEADRLHDVEGAGPGDQTDSRLSFNFFRMHRFEGIHPPAQAGTGNGPTTTDDANGSPALIPVLLVGVRSAPPNPLLGVLERIAGPVSAVETAGVGADEVDSGPEVSTDSAEDDREGAAVWEDDANDEARSTHSGSPTERPGSFDSLDEGSIGLRRIFQDQSEDSFEAWSDDNDDGGQDTVDPSAERPPVAHTAVPPPPPPAFIPDTLSSPPHRSWLIFVLAGLYPESHPIFTAPSLFIPHGLHSTNSAQPNDPTSTSTMEGRESGSDSEELDGNRTGLISRLRGTRPSQQEGGEGRTRPDLIEDQLLDYEAMVRLAQLIGHNTLNSPFFGTAATNKPPNLVTLTQQEIDDSLKFKKFSFGYLNDHRKHTPLVSSTSSHLVSEDHVGSGAVGSDDCPPDDDHLEGQVLDGFESFALADHVDLNGDGEDSISVLENTIEKCLICLDEYDDEDQVEILECKHMFHKPCVDHWLTKCVASCPVCRRPAVC